MTPKEKAEELVEKFDLPSGLMSIERKQCALIAVDEIKDALYDEMTSSNTYQYWVDVRTEIELL